MKKFTKRALTHRLLLVKFDHPRLSQRLVTGIQPHFRKVVVLLKSFEHCGLSEIVDPSRPWIRRVIALHPLLRRLLDRLPNPLVLRDEAPLRIFNDLLQAVVDRGPDVFACGVDWSDEFDLPWESFGHESDVLCGLRQGELVPRRDKSRPEDS